MTHDDAMHSVRVRTTPRPDAIARVRHRLDLRLRSAKPELDGLPGPTSAAVARVRARLREVRPRRRRWAWGLAAGALLAGAGAMAAWLGRPPPSVDQALVDGTIQLAPGVHAVADGSGHASGTAERVLIEWHSGRLVLDVTTPVRVVTAEGAVDLEAGHLALVRDARGSTLEAVTGAHALTCAEPLGPVCLPTTPEGLLARGQALAADGAAPEQVLAALDAALARDAADPIRVELHSARIAPLLAMGDSEGALAAAEAGLAVPSPRAASLHRTAARLRLLAGDCAGALPHLQALPDPTPEERAYLDRCRQP